MVMASIYFLRASFLLALSQPAAAASGCAGHACGKDRDALEPEGLGPEADAEFEVFRKSFRRNYEHGSKEYWLRKGLYEQRTAMVKTHNARLDRLWQAAAGPFADFTEAERKSMRGYKSSPLSKSGGVELPAAAAKEREFLRPQAKIPKEFNWMNLTMARIVPDQGQCGSCWAVASKSVLDAHHEIYVSKGGPLFNFSAQQIVSCVPNPRVCGGTGGCGGATVELAFDWVVHNGCADQADVPYLAKDLSAEKAKCASSKQLSAKSLLGASHHQHEQAMPAMGGFLLGMHGYHMLERNKEQPLLMAVYQHGPVAMSVAADAWFEYKSGIFDGCPKDNIVDHAVTLFGFGEATAKQHDDPNSFPVLLTPVQRRHGHDNESPHFESSVKKYWLIRNSWGVSWGESGFIRMLRAGGFGEANERCGTDTDNSQGTGCKGDNKTVQVCGMCGSLWDSVVPHFQPITSLAEKSMLELDPAGKLVRREGSN